MKRLTGAAALVSGGCCQRTAARRAPLAALETVDSVRTLRSADVKQTDYLTVQGGAPYEPEPAPAVRRRQAGHQVYSSACWDDEPPCCNSPRSGELDLNRVSAGRWKMSSRADPGAVAPPSCSATWITSTGCSRPHRPELLGAMNSKGAGGAGLLRGPGAFDPARSAIP